MAKHNPGDILTEDWNPIIGCRKYSAGCVNCWYLGGIFPWQQRLGIIPPDVRPDEAYVFENRMSVENLRIRNGIVGVCQNGDLFWDEVPDGEIHRVFDIIEHTVERKRKIPKYLFWTKRAERMSRMINERYPGGAPGFLAFAVSIEDAATAEERLPWLVRLNGCRVLAAEPLLEPVDIHPFASDVHWIIVGSETGKGARPLDKDWARRLRDSATKAGRPFFIKQLGTSHKDGIRELDGRVWNEFPPGFSK